MTSPLRDRCSIGLLLLLAAPPAASQITVVSGTYGMNMGASGNATADLTTLCGRQFACSYNVSVQRLGDPYPGWQKDYLATWTCPGDSAPRTTYVPPEANGATLTLSCQVFNASSSYEVLSRGLCLNNGTFGETQYSPFVVHRPGTSSYVMYRCKNSIVNGVGRDRIWRSESTGDGTGAFTNDQIVVAGSDEQQQDDLSCGPGVIVDSSGTWQMYYLTASR